MTQDLVLEARSLTKRFPGVVANSGVSLSVHRGEIVALLGENGAGKSTLVKMLYGLLQPDDGEILVDGEHVVLAGPRTAIRHGIGMVHQHFQLVPAFTVLENVILGSEPRTWPFVNTRRAAEEVRELATQYGLAVDISARISDLPVGAQQRVEILKALYRRARVLILDEPTAVLTPQETDQLLSVVRGFADSGVAVVFISHKLREVLAIADTIEVLRGGRVVGTTRPDETNQSELARMMVGRSVLLSVDPDPVEAGDVVLDIAGLSVANDLGLAAVRDVSLQVRRCEIVGIAGVEGNGQRELVEAIAGLRPYRASALSVDGKDARNKSAAAMHGLGIGHVPEDREKDGLVGSYSIVDNLVLNRFSEPQFSNRGIRNKRSAERHAKALVQEYDVRSPSAAVLVQTLSGGNKQKVVIARELSANPAILIASQPTRGVDVGSIEFIHSQFVSARDQGAGVLLVSAELDEVLGLSDRILVMYGGRFVAEFPRDSVDREQIGRLMAGGLPE